MAKLVMDFYQGETEYSDGDIEAELLDIVKENDSFDKVLETDRRWPIVYHLYHLRQNILNWYPFKKDAEVLEVGAGCGALTGLLCERAAHVTAVELTRRRAEINYNRNKNNDNLDIYVGDLFKIGFNKKFDYITVIGVLEYAALMSLEKDPYSDFLRRIKGFLKPDGRILLAIENRLGLKYFAGAREDHTAHFFDGINNYEENSRIRTFTKSELEELLDKNSLGAHRFYYPLPDYKFPTCIYTDKSIVGFDSYMDLSAHDNQRFELFDELGVMRALAKDNVLGSFANSFFVDIGQDGAQTDDSVAMVKLSATRNPPYRIATVIRQSGADKLVYKIPLSDECRPHLRQIAENFTRYGSLHGLKLVPCRIDADSNAVFDFATGRKFSTLIENAISDQGEDALWPLLDSYREKLMQDAKVTSDFYSDAFVSSFGTERINGEFACISPANVDLSLDNLIVNDDGTTTVVDYEWIFDFAVPVDYIFWRAIMFSDIFKSNRTLLDEVFYHYGIDKAKFDTFMQWDCCFSKEIIESMALPDAPSIKLDLNMINEKEHLSNITTGVAFDYGEGFDYKHEVRRGVRHIGRVCTMQALVTDGVKQARFDPVEGFACQCHIISAKCGDKVLCATPANNVSSDDSNDFFLTSDPVYILSGNFESGQILEIEFIASRLDQNAADVALAEKIQIMQANKDRIAQLEKQLDESRHAYDRVVNSKSWKITAPIRKCTNAFQNKNN